MRHNYDKKLLASRLHTLNSQPVLPNGKSVIYVMSRDQRTVDNAALYAAQQTALKYKLPLAVVFCLYDKIEKRAREHVELMLAGLQKVEAELAAFGVPFVLVIGNPEQRLAAVLHHYTPAAVFFDMSPLRGPRKLHATLASRLPCAAWEVDAHNCVPVWVTSQKQEFAARTFRPKVMKSLVLYAAEPLYVLTSHPHKWPGTVESLKKLERYTNEVLQGLRANGTDLSYITPGYHGAVTTIENFVDNLPNYALSRNDPTQNAQSGLSPYLHFGWVSAREVVKLLLAQPSTPSREAFIEELVVRRELSDNYCYYNQSYDSSHGLADWARRTLKAHADDRREFLYTYEQLAAAQTHDELWNAAQRQLLTTGKMHGYMRMYWAKKVLEWTADVDSAISYLVRMNDFYSVDGGDPNGYVGILWSVGGLHDRPWFNRPIYGLVRYMSATGMQKKFDIRTYCANWNEGS